MKLGVRHPGPVRGMACEVVPAPAVGPGHAGAGVGHGLGLEALLNVLAECVAEKVRAKLAPDGRGAPRPRLLSVEQAAVYLGRTKEAVQHMVASRKLPVVRDGRRVFLDVQDLDRWIENHTEPAEDLTRRAA